MDGDDDRVLGQDDVHFSCHGNESSIELTDGTKLFWRELGDLGWPHLKQKSLVFSSCLVGRGAEALFHRCKTFCRFVVGPTIEISWAEGLVTYTAFYHRATLSKTSSRRDVKLMNDILLKKGAFAFIDSPAKTVPDTQPLIGRR